jgi:hypothetical protein
MGSAGAMMAAVLLLLLYTCGPPVVVPLLQMTIIHKDHEVSIGI